MMPFILIVLACAGPWDNIRAVDPWENIVATPIAGDSKEGVPTVLPLAPRADEIMRPVVPAGTTGESLAPRILRWERRCGPNGCVMVPVYEENVDLAAVKLQGWRNLPEDEAKRLADIVDAPAVAKAIRQEFDIATCGMVCKSHGSKLYDVFEDGTVEVAKEQPASVESQSGRGGQ